MATIIIRISDILISKAEPWFKSVINGFETEDISAAMDKFYTPQQTIIHKNSIAFVVWLIKLGHEIILFDSYDIDELEIMARPIIVPALEIANKHSINYYCRAHIKVISIIPNITDDIILRNYISSFITIKPVYIIDHQSMVAKILNENHIAIFPCTFNNIHRYLLGIKKTEIEMCRTTNSLQQCSLSTVINSVSLLAGILLTIFEDEGVEICSIYNPQKPIVATHPMAPKPAMPQTIFLIQKGKTVLDDYQSAEHILRLCIRGALINKNIITIGFRNQSDNSLHKSHKKGKCSIQ